MSQAEAAMPPIAGRLVRPHRDRRRGLAGEGGISLLLHGVVLALLLMALPRSHLSESYSPTDIAVVFDGGPKTSAPQTLEGRKSAPTETPDTRSTEPRPPAPMTPPSPPSRAAATSAPATPTPPTVAPSPPATAAAPKVEQGPSALSLPMPAPTHTAQPRPPTSHPQPTHRAAPRSLSSSLSAPMNFSFGGAPPPASNGHLQRGITMAMAPTDQNRNIMTRYAEARHRLGEDWWNEFSNFVEEHKYYPMSAAERNEDGQVVLHLVIERDGSVRSATVELSSGSPRLDMAWISEFRGAKVPPFPAGTTDSEVSFSASMNYILEHM